MASFLFSFLFLISFFVYLFFPLSCPPSSTHAQFDSSLHSSQPPKNSHGALSGFLPRPVLLLNIPHNRNPSRDRRGGGAGRSGRSQHHNKSARESERRRRRSYPPKAPHFQGEEEEGVIILKPKRVSLSSSSSSTTTASSCRTVASGLPVAPTAARATDAFKISPFLLACPLLPLSCR